METRGSVNGRTDKGLRETETIYTLREDKESGNTWEHSWNK